MTQSTRLHDQLPAPNLVWDGDTPRSTDFDDIYYSPRGGLEEARHVFLRGNRLPERFPKVQSFTLGELGTGTGLNLLAAWQLRNEVHPSMKLHMVSVEGMPMRLDDLARAHAAYPEIAPLSARLRDVWPPPRWGIHRRWLAEGVILTLVFMPIEDALEEGLPNCDAFFLDGFAPAHNPDLWSADVLDKVRASLSDGSGTLATYTAVGEIRRSLVQLGLNVEKVPGFAGKRDMLVAQQMKPEPDRDRGDARIIQVVGAGIAGAAVAASLKQRGIEAHVIDRFGPASGASGNPLGLVGPMLQKQATPGSRWAHFSSLGLASAMSLKPTPSLWVPQNDAHLARFEALIESSDRPGLRLLTAHEASDLANVPMLSPCLLDPEAWIVQPRELVSDWLSEAYLTLASAQTVPHTFSGAVWCTAWEDSPVSSPHWKLQRTAGQLVTLPASSLPAQPRAILRGEGYFIPPTGGVAAVGATYHSRTVKTATLASASEDLLARLQQWSPALAMSHAVGDARISVRAVTPDRLPLVGTVPLGLELKGQFGLKSSPQTNEGLLVLNGDQMITGLGSRGLSSAWLAAEMVVSTILGEYPAVDRAMAASLAPRRFYDRDRRRGLY